MLSSSSKIVKMQKLLLLQLMALHSMVIVLLLKNHAPRSMNVVKGLVVLVQVLMMSAGSATRWVTGLVTAELEEVHQIEETAEGMIVVAIDEAIQEAVPHHATDAEDAVTVDIVVTEVIAVMEMMVLFDQKS